MNLSKLRLITFDVTDTLLQFRAAPGRQYGEIGALYGVLSGDDELAANFKNEWYRMNKEHPNFGLKSGLGWENWWKEIIGGTFKDAYINIDKKKLNAISEHLIDIYKTTTCWQQCYGALGLLSYVRSKKVPMGIISNFDPRLSTILSNTKLLHYFNFVLTSYEAGFEKPDRQIFEAAMNASKLDNLKPEECLHIGDTPISDYFGAKNCNWNAILIHDKGFNYLRGKYNKNGSFDDQDVYSSLYQLHKTLITANEENLLSESNF